MIRLFLVLLILSPLTSDAIFIKGVKLSLPSIFSFYQQREAVDEKDELINDLEKEIKVLKEKIIEAKKMCVSMRLNFDKNKREITEKYNLDLEKIKLSAESNLNETLAKEKSKYHNQFSKKIEKEKEELLSKFNDSQIQTKNLHSKVTKLSEDLVNLNKLNKEIKQRMDEESIKYKSIIESYKKKEKSLQQKVESLNLALKGKNEPLQNDEQTKNKKQKIHRGTNSRTTRFNH